MISQSPPAPPILYKYYPPERVDIFDNWSVRFSNPRTFNDLFDCDLKPHERRLPGKSLKDLQTAGVFCMTTDPDSPVMWAHYAASHTGFVLAFKTDIEPFSEFGGPQRVEYQQTFNPMPFSGDPPIEIFRVKSSRWAHEKEWRCIRRFRVTDSRDLHLPVEAIAEIIIGARIQQIALNTILQIAHWAKPDYDIPISESKPKRHSRELSHRPTLYEICENCDGYGHLRRKAAGV